MKLIVAFHNFANAPNNTLRFGDRIVPRLQASSRTRSDSCFGRSEPATGTDPGPATYRVMYDT